jgi:hypothetical protein
VSGEHHIRCSGRLIRSLRWWCVAD